MRRTDLAEATMQGWARLDAAQRERFFEAFLSAALRLDRLELRAWLRRRLQNAPLAAPVDPGSLIFADADIASLLQAACEVHTGRKSKKKVSGSETISPGRLSMARYCLPGEAAAGPDRDKADGNTQANAPARI